MSGHDFVLFHCSCVFLFSFIQVSDDTYAASAFCLLVYAFCFLLLLLLLRCESIPGCWRCGVWWLQTATTRPSLLFLVAVMRSKPRRCSGRAIAPVAAALPLLQLLLLLRPIREATTCIAYRLYHPKAARTSNCSSSSCITGKGLGQVPEMSHPLHQRRAGAWCNGTFCQV